MLPREANGYGARALNVIVLLPWVALLLAGLFNCSSNARLVPSQDVSSETEASPAVTQVASPGHRESLVTPRNVTVRPRAEPDSPGAKVMTPGSDGFVGDEHAANSTAKARMDKERMKAMTDDTSGKFETRIGFIGLGVMGKPMASHLLAKGYPLVVHSRSRGPVDALVAAGALAAASPVEVAQQSDVVITMLPDTPDVEAVLTGPDGVIGGLAKGGMVIDMSSISPVAARALAAKVEEAGCTMLDAPVSGGEIGAINASLSIMVGGPAAAFDRARPIFECLGHADRIVHIGAEPGSGQLCKVCNQIAIGGALAGVSEALALARKAGVDGARVRQALLGGFASSRVLEVHGERILTGQFAPGFRTRLYQKDLRIALEAGAANGAAMPTATLVAALVDALVASGGADLDYSAVGTML